MMFQEQHSCQIRFTSSAPVLLCPLSALVHAQTTLTLTSANTQGVNELKSLIPKPIQPAQCGVLPTVFSSFAHQGGSHRVERPNMQLSD